MNAVPFSYIARNLWVRRVTTLLTAGGMALVVYVFATVLMMSEGIRSTLVATGQPDNVMVLRQGAGAEINSAIERSQAAILSTLPGIATDAAGPPAAQRRAGGADQPAQAQQRQAQQRDGARHLRRSACSCGRSVQIVEGRMFRPGTSEIVVGRSTASGFAGIDIGASLRFAGRDWLIVGRFDAGRSGFDSEIWGDAEQMAAGLPPHGVLHRRLPPGRQRPVRQHRRPASTPTRG